MTKICKVCGRMFDTKFKAWEMCSKSCASEKTIQEKFHDRINKTETCWLWTGGTDAAGYGRFTHRGQYILAHRYAYVLWNGPIPGRNVPDHLCRNRRCVNPAHLEAVTEQVNILRGIGVSAINARKTHCIRGHELIPGNFLPARGKKHGRDCLVCRNIRNKMRANPSIKLPPRTDGKPG